MIFSPTESPNNNVSVHLVFDLETVLRSFMAQKPDLISPNLDFTLETVLRSVMAQRPDPFFNLPTEGAGRVDTAFRVFR
jgi:hypothetical protein